MIRKNRKYDDLSIVLRDFHFMKDNDIDGSIYFCFLVLNDGSMTCGSWWSTNDDGTKGKFIRGTADSLAQEDVYAWLPIDHWNCLEPLSDGEVNQVNVGSKENYTVELTDFHSINKGELPQQDQYCFLILKDGKMSGGRWQDGGPYLKQPGYFEHAPAACNIDCNEVWAWTALDPYREIEEKAEPVKEEKKKEKKRLSADRKFKYGYDVEVYIDKAVEKLQKEYCWVTREYLNPDYRFAIEKEDGYDEFVEYCKDGKGWERKVLEGYFNDDLDGDGFISEISFCSEYYAVYKNSVIAQYSVPFKPTDTGGGWYLEHYIFYKRASGDYTVNVQAGNRTTGGAREFGIPRDCFQKKTFDEFLDEYQKIVPGNMFGLTKEDLINDKELKAFLGY